MLLEQQTELEAEKTSRSHSLTNTTLGGPHRGVAIATLVGLWLALFFGSLFAPSLLDDADATHSNAARHMALTGDWVTLRVNGIRYLEKAPLPYWLVAMSFKVFGFNTFAAHLPQAIGVLLLALLGYGWSARAFGGRTGFYAGISTLTAAGVFLFTRVFIPEVLLSLLLATALYCLLETLATGSRGYAYAMWSVLALAVLTKGLVAIVFCGGAGVLYLALSGEYIQWKRLRPFTGALLFFAIAAPWHILAGLRNVGGINGHGFFWFYFINEHFLRFLGKRVPMDYNKLPGYLFWSLHIVWLFPWALFLPVLVRQAWTTWRTRQQSAPMFEGWPLWTAYAVAMSGIALRAVAHVPYLLTVAGAGITALLVELVRRRRRAGVGQITDFGERTTLMLTIFVALVLGFFSLSTNQEYYTFPAYLPLLMLLAQSMVKAEQNFSTENGARWWLGFAHGAYTVMGAAVFAALAYGLWSSRHLPFVPDIGDLLAHRGVGDYTLSMSHLFDLTDQSFAGLRLPAGLAAAAFALGPATAWILRRRQWHMAATMSIATTSAVFLIAAHIALVRFGPMLSSEDLAEKIEELQDDGTISRVNTVMLYGDQAYGSSIPFYLGRDVELIEGRSTSMWFGSTFPDAPPIFKTNADLLGGWGKGERKLLFVPLEKRDDVDKVLGKRQILLEETSGKALITDRPLDKDPAHDMVHISSRP